MNEIYLSLGSNLGNRAEHIANALDQIKKHIGPILRVSNLYQTPPLGFSSDEQFLNCCAHVATDLKKNVLIERIHSIEAVGGRIRASEGYASRTIDIDVLYYNKEVDTSPALTLPHPRIYSRKFVLIPLNEIAPDWVDPKIHLTVSQLLLNCPDKSHIEQYANE